MNEIGYDESEVFQYSRSIRSPMQTFERTAFSTSRTLEFFTEKELTMQIGCSLENWPIVLLKELIDNALDACENSNLDPHIKIFIEENSLSVEDNGPGLPLEVLQQSLDYGVRVSTNNHYVSPTRGQLGNALKCLWAAGCVATGKSHIEIYAHGQRHQLKATVDEIAQEPKIDLKSQPAQWETGTLVKIHWPGIASYLDGSNPQVFTNAQTLCWEYGLFNPHVTIDCQMPQDTQPLQWATLTDQNWKKWKPSQPTSPWWYSQSEFEELIKAYLKQERDGGRSLTIREFIAEFAGLTGTQKQKAILHALNVAGQPLSSLTSDSKLNTALVACLHREMQINSKSISPHQLGVIGQDHGISQLANGLSVIPNTLNYKKVVGNVSKNIPFVVEAWFGICPEQSQRWGIYGLNFTPVFQCPFDYLLQQLWNENYIDYDDPILLGVHITYPKFEFVERGKGRLRLPQEISEAVQKTVQSVAKSWKKQKKSKRREDKLLANEFRKNQQCSKVTYKNAAYEVMEKAYLAASDNNTLPANARQIMYAARPLVLELTGGECWKKSSYFTQHLLPDFINEHPRLTESWDVVYDARGNFIEPHTAKTVPIGTLKVREYQNSWTSPDLSIHELSIDQDVKTSGPQGRYSAALFIEKEGFNALLERGRVAERFDIALMSTKGMSVTAARSLVESLTNQGVKIFVLHDFDKSGISIQHTLKTDTRRYQFEQKPDVIDLGLRLTDVHALNLQEEPVDYSSKADPRINLRKSGATEEECNFLVREQVAGKKWTGDRVELNAMTSRQFLTFIERKLEEHGVRKVVPDRQTLELAYRRAIRLQRVQAAIEQAITDTESLEIDIPQDLHAQIQALVDGQPHSWDMALMKLISGQKNDCA